MLVDDKMIARLCIPLTIAVTLILLACSGLTSGCETTLCCPDCPTESVLRVTGGDTFDTSTLVVRLLGVDAPVEGDRCFEEARERLARLAHTVVRVESGPEVQDILARRLYYVYTDLGESIDETLIVEGLARESHREGQHLKRLLQLDRAAQREGTGCLF